MKINQIIPKIIFTTISVIVFSAILFGCDTGNGVPPSPGPGPSPSPSPTPTPKIMQYQSIPPTTESGCGDVDSTLKSGGLEIPGTVPEGCIEESRASDGSPVEICDAEPAINHPESSEVQTEEKTVVPPSPQADTPWISAASNSQKLSASTKQGASLTATIVWKDKKSFELKNVKLKDTKCDGYSVYFYASYSTAWDYPEHYNKSGCNTTAVWSSLKGSFGPTIRSLTLNVCRSWSSNCGYVTSINPYYAP